MDDLSLNKNVIMIAPLVGLIMLLPGRLFVNFLYRKFRRLPGSQEPYYWDVFESVRFFASLVAFFECTLYAGGWLLGHTEVVAIVLGLKIAPVIKEWSDPQPLGRAMFNIWLSANFFNVIGSILIAELLSQVV